MSAQIREKLILNGEQVSMAFRPPIPENNSRITEIDWKTLKDPIFKSTALWRRYIGTWEIKDEKLYLVNIEGKYILSGGEPLFADWVSGQIVIQQGELLEYVHTGFCSIYERELLIDIVDGVVVGSKIVEAMDNPMYKEALEHPMTEDELNVLYN